jgi:membrane-bound lytic murein transglycosylase F
MERIRRWFPAGLALVLLGPAGCDGPEPPPAPPIERDWAAIQATDTLRVLTTFNSTSYFIYRAEPMGFEYELLTAFARDHDLQLRTQVVRDRGELLDRLARGEGDVVAARLMPERDQHERAVFTRSLYETPPAVVQRTAEPGGADLPAPVDTMLPGVAAQADGPIALRVRRVGQPGDLAGETVHVAEGTAFLDRLIEISDSITGDIEVVEVEGDVRTEALIRDVARGEIDLAVSPANLAALSDAYFTNVEAAPTIGPAYEVAMAVRSNAPELLERLDAWIGENEQLMGQLYQRYFVDRQGYRARVESEYLTSETGRLGPYDDLFRRHAQRIGWDWRLLASLSFQESRFNPRARSWAGAMGLVQLMPGTARALGVRDPWDPEQNVAGGVLFLRDLITRWTPEIPDPDERLKFVLASYNVGPGHVEDAQRLTEAHGGDPLIWEQVAHWLLQKSKREVYTHPVVRHGFARGLEPVTYVGVILRRFDHYRQFVIDEAPAPASP